jgi:rare lipoprotein A
MDVSELAARNLGMIAKGTAKVKLELMPAESRAIAQAARNGVRTNGVEVVMNQTGRLPDSYHQYLQESGSYQIASNGMTPPPPAVAETMDGPVPGHISHGNFYPDPVVTQQPVTQSNIYIQAGAFGSQENATRLAGQLNSLAPTKIEPVNYNGRVLYKVKLGPVDNVAKADSILNRVLANGQTDARIVVQ